MWRDLDLASFDLCESPAEQEKREDQLHCFVCVRTADDSLAYPPHKHAGVLGFLISDACGSGVVADWRQRLVTCHHVFETCQGLTSPSRVHVHQLMPGPSRSPTPDAACDHYAQVSKQRSLHDVDINISDKPLQAPDLCAHLPPKMTIKWILTIAQVQAKLKQLRSDASEAGVPVRYILSEKDLQLNAVRVIRGVVRIFDEDSKYKRDKKVLLVTYLPGGMTPDARGGCSGALVVAELPAALDAPVEERFFPLGIHQSAATEPITLKLGPGKLINIEHALQAWRAACSACTDETQICIEAAPVPLQLKKQETKTTNAASMPQ
jgi:hypothetical protein